MSELAEVADDSRHHPADPSTISYGALAANLPESLESHKLFYVSTAIAYTNGYPHIGHAYEFLLADVIVRFRRVLGYKTFFLTGADEHGQKVAASAEAAGRTPEEHCTIYVNAFKALNQRLLVTNTDYLRTTDARHAATAQKLWCLCADNDDIYLDQYSGWYNEREETFVPDAEAEAAEFKDLSSGLPLKRVSEESYFFRLSKYTDRLLSHIEEDPSFIQPEQYRNNIVARLKKEGLKDLSISRTSFKWGIPVPAGFDPRHVMYVWFDALSNYLTGVNALEAGDPLSCFWPANAHLIGKDITWFHCVIWPCMLMSARVPLPCKMSVEACLIPSVRTYCFGAVEINPPALRLNCICSIRFRCGPWFC
jgi:methionyl-tRNA synthetase